MALIYETKCRRCGKIHEWAFLKSYEQTNEESWKNLHTWVWEHMIHPSVCRCDKCNKSTIQDYIAYTEKGGM